MIDLKRKIEMIGFIEQLQLPHLLIQGLDDVQRAEDIAKAVYSLQNLAEQWNQVILFQLKLQPQYGDLLTGQSI